jgi:hypothetical protein
MYNNILLHRRKPYTNVDKVVSVIAANWIDLTMGYKSHCFSTGGRLAQIWLFCFFPSSQPEEKLGFFKNFRGSTPSYTLNLLSCWGYGKKL